MVPVRDLAQKALSIYVSLRFAYCLGDAAVLHISIYIISRLLASSDTAEKDEKMQQTKEWLTVRGDLGLLMQLKLIFSPGQAIAARPMSLAHYLENKSLWMEGNRVFHQNLDDYYNLQNWHHTHRGAEVAKFCSVVLWCCGPGTTEIRFSARIFKAINENPTNQNIKYLFLHMCLSWPHFSSSSCKSACIVSVGVSDWDFW